jgi:hypothetical protein
MFKNHSTKKLTERYLRLIKHLQTQKTRPQIGGGYVDVREWAFDVGRYFYVFPDVRAAYICDEIERELYRRKCRRQQLDKGCGERDSR